MDIVNSIKCGWLIVLASYLISMIMKTYIYIFVGIFLLSCSKKSEEYITNESYIKRGLEVDIKIDEKYDNYLQIDSIFTKIEAIPLETSENCQIMDPVKVVFHDDKYYIQNGSMNLFVFDKDGSYINEVGEKGKGPGEFLELRDFFISGDSIISILDFSKIINYNIEGRYINNKICKYKPKDVIHVNPMQFCKDNFNNTYIWGGSFSIFDNNKNNLFQVYKLDESGNIIERYFPVKHKTQLFYNYFSKYNDIINLTPTYGVDTIFSIVGDNIIARYALDFMGNKMKKEVPNNFEDISYFKAEIDQRYANNIFSIIENDNWLHFKFQYQKLIYNVYFSKVTNKSFVSKIFPRTPNRLMPWYIHGSYSDKFISLIEPRVLLKDIDRLENICKIDAKIIKRTSNLDVLDNYVLLICKTKCY